jgi:phosphoglycolate phosphatase
LVFRLVVFDLDGTLIDSVKVHAEGWSYAFNVLGLADVGADDLESLIGLPGSAIVEKVLGQAGLAYYREIRWLKDRHLLNHTVKNSVRLFPDALPCLQYLRRMGYRLGIATSTPNYILIPLLEKLGIIDFFDITVGGDEVLRGKPEPDIFLRAAEKAGLPPREVVVVGDTTYDTVPARKAGMLSVLVARSRPIRVDELVADVVVTSLNDLSAFL